MSSHMVQARHEKYVLSKEQMIQSILSITFCLTKRLSVFGWIIDAFIINQLSRHLSTYTQINDVFCSTSHLFSLRRTVHVLFDPERKIIFFSLRESGKGLRKKNFHSVSESRQWLPILCSSSHHSSVQLACSDGYNVILSVTSSVVTC